MKYSFHPYHKYFPHRAEEEIERLKKFIPESKIEHIGSTSIPGVGGKGIVDIYVAVSKDQLAETSLIIQSLGYEFKYSGGVDNERLFHQRTQVYTNKRRQTFHVHLTYYGYCGWDETISFRNFLRNNPDYAKEYSDIKHKAVKAAKAFRKKKDKKEAYMNAKKPVIEKILRILNKKTLS